MPDRPHGYARHKLDGCRCYTCGWAVSQYRANRERAIAYGTWQPWTDATPTRDHILALRDCGMGSRQVAALADVARTDVLRAVSLPPSLGGGQREKIRPATAAAILSVEPTLDNLAPATVISATGTTRRLQALVASGWPQQAIADRLGVRPGNLATLLRRDRTLVRTARAVRDLYAALWLTDPMTVGVSAVSVGRSRAVGDLHGWAPVGAWDEDTIDDPAAEPEWTGVCGSVQGYEIHRRLGTRTCARCRTARTAYNLSTPSRRKHLAA